jgi:cysteine synthase A
MQASMGLLPPHPEPVDSDTYRRAARHFRDANIVLPTLAQLADPRTIPESVRAALSAVDPDRPDPLNLFRVHWFNPADRTGTAPVPEHLVLPSDLTGVAAPIVMALGDRFPMIGAHKVLAAYACLVPRIVTGRFDPTRDRAVWPSTGNYCRGGVAISRILGCRGVAVLPEGMSRERFEWLEQWVGEPDDIVRTPGRESNVKEIYDACAELSRDPANIVLNQFSEFANHLVHYLCTGRAMERIFEFLLQRKPDLRLQAFVAATGSAGTIAAGDHLKERYGAAIVAAEAQECPTMLRNGYGEHNIQGIGDKHIPLIHNVLNTDVVTAISDRATDGLGLVFNTPEGRDYLRSERGVPEDVLQGLGSLGLSSICNLLAAIKVAKHFDLGPHDVILTVATDGAPLYASERERTLERRFGGRFDRSTAAATFAEHILEADTDQLLELTTDDRERIFNLGYFTWVEQQGVSLEDFERRREPRFWSELHHTLPVWDELIESFNARVGAAGA